MKDLETLRATAFVVLGDSRRALLVNVLRERLQRWACEWLGPEATVRGDVLASPMVATDNRLHEAACFRAAASGRGSLIFLIPGRCVPQLLGIQDECGEPSTQRAPEDSLAGRLEIQALQSLARQLLGGEALPGVDRITNPLPAVLRECVSCRDVAVQVSFADPRLFLFVMLPAQFVETAVPQRSAARGSGGERLEARRTGVTEELVQVEAVLGTAEVSVADFCVLDVGDVIVLDQTLTDMAGLFVRDGSRVAGAAPGRVDGRRAIQITG